LTTLNLLEKPDLLTRRAALTLSCAPLLAACAGGQVQARVGPASFAPLVKQVLPAVVNIAVVAQVSSGDDPLDGLPPDLRRQFRNRLPQRRREVRGAGSGFVIDPAGLVVTNAHVIEGATQIVVAFGGGQELPAQVVGVDDLTDLAVIRVKPAAPLAAVSWGDSRAVEVGDWVIAAGNPFGLGGSVTAGIVSARGRDIGSGPFDDFIQIDAPINPGNSGGPLFNAEGGVVGINSEIYSPTGSSVGIGFAIPSELARRITEELAEKGRIDRGWLGVSMAETAKSGVAVAEVARGGPAGRAGVRPGDIISAINGISVDDPRALLRAVAAVPPGQSVRLALKRAGRTIELPVTVGRRPDSEQ
jgi:serine protease Do